MKFGQAWLGAAIAAIALVCARPAAAQIGVVSVTGGRVEGVTANGVTSFKSIPFAAPPVGALRWRAPQPVRPWSGIKKADHFGPSCMQDPKALKHVYGAPAAMSEDCLYLNVWTPARFARARRAVMVWIYGGGFTGGSTSQPVYDGTRLATKGVVLVSIAYRTGALGFLADSELSVESPHHTSGNYGLLDVIAALRWVRGNIGKFGGDPSRVTIFGQSSGAGMVAALAVSPLAKGLFQRGIAESSSGPIAVQNEKGISVPPVASAETVGRRFLAAVGAHDIAAARALPAEALVAAQARGARFYPLPDGYVLPDNLHEHELSQAGRFNDTPLLLGTNADEGRLLVPPGMTPAKFDALIRAKFGSYANAILTLYPHATDEQAEQAARDLFRDSVIAYGTLTLARLYSREGTDKVYLYYFDRRSPQSSFGPVHADELGYVFGTLGSHAPFWHSPPGSGDEALSSLMQNYWANFARTGNPNGPGLPHWPAFSASSQRVMYLDAHPHAGPVPNLKKLKVLDAYFAWLRKEAKKKRAN